MFSIYTYEAEADRYFTFGEFENTWEACQFAFDYLPHGNWIVVHVWERD